MEKSPITRNYPNAASGVSKLFKGEVLELIGTVILLVSGIVTVLTFGSMAVNMGEPALGLGIFSIIFVLSALVLLLISFFLEIIGLKRAGRDNVHFQNAFWYIIALIVLTVLGNVISNPTFSSLFKAIARFADVFVAYDVITGCMELLEGHPLADKGREVRKMVVAAGILCAVSNVFSGSSGFLAGLIELAAAIVTVIYYIMYLSFLAKAKREL